jgi:hypothetical protein
LVKHPAGGDAFCASVSRATTEDSEAVKTRKLARMEKT